MLTGVAAWVLLMQSSALKSAPTDTLLDRRDVKLSAKLIKVAKDHPYTKCAATALRARQTPDEYGPTAKVLGTLKEYPAAKGTVEGNLFVEFLIKDVPCW